MERDAGAATLEYVGVLVVLAAVVVVLVSSFSSSRTLVVQGVSCAVDTLLGQSTGCAGLGLPGSGSGDAERSQELLDQAQALESYAQSGQATQDLLEQAQQAVEDGHLSLAQTLLDQLSLYQDLASTEPRGSYLRDLFAASDQEYEDLMAAGTMYFDGGAYNTAYFQLEDPPGGGVVVMDFFIDSTTTGGLLKGDDREHADPLRGDLGLQESRMLFLVDLETGRGQVYVTETCMRVPVCNEPRPNVFDGSYWSNDTGTSPLIPILDNDYDIANQFWVTPADGGFQLRYDALNGIIPIGSVDGTVSVHVGDDGRLRIGEDDRDDYPSIGTYYYSEPGQTQVVQQREQESVECGALPFDLPFC